MSTVSVIIPTYNSAEYLSETIESVLSQTYKDYEIIVVDDGSTDNTKEVLKAFEEKIRYLYKENGGPASARNVGIRLAKGEYIAFLDSDDLWIPEKLELQIEFFRTHPDVGLVYSDALTINEEGQVIPSTKKKKRVHPDIFYYLFEESVIPILTVIVRKECFDRVGLFDESKNIISSEDLDMWLRIARYYKLGYIDKPLAKYRFHQGSISRNIDQKHLARKNVIEKNLDNLEKKGCDIRKLKRFVKRGLFKLFFGWGYRYVKAGDLEKARKQFNNAMQYKPLSIKNYIYYLMTFTNLPTIRFVKRVKRFFVSTSEI